MKGKNDFRDNGDLRIEVTQPPKCLQCGCDRLEQVALSGTNSRPFILRFSEKTGLSRFFPKQHHLYGWRCMEYGYIMWFTARYLD